MALPKLRQLEYFIAVINQGSFIGAAETCHFTQSTLSAGIKDLEEILGQSLIDRSFKSATLTPFGRSIEPHCRKLLQDAQAITAMARAAEDPLSGTLRLGIIPTIAPYALPQLLPLIQKQLPNLDLHIHEDLSARLVEQLHHGTIDCAFMAFPFPIGEAEIRILIDEPFMLARPKGQGKTPSKIKTSSLKGEDILLLDDGHCLRDHALEACALAPQNNRKAFSASSLPTLIEMVKNAHGQTLLPQMAITKDIAKSMDIIPFSNPIPTRQIGLAWRKNTLPAALIDALAALISTKFLQDT